MRISALPFSLAVALTGTGAEPLSAGDAAMLRRIYDAALAGSPAYARLGELVDRHPGRLSGSARLEGAVRWAQDALARQGVDRTELQQLQLGGAALAALVHLADQHGL